MMGAGIAYAQASKGMTTVLKDVSQDKADAGKAYSAKITQSRVDTGRMSQGEQAALLSRITATDQVADLAGCELIIEAVFERRDLKAKVTQEAEPLLAPGGFRVEHLHLADCQPGHGQRPARKIHRHPFLQPGRQNEAGRDHSRQADR